MIGKDVKIICIDVAHGHHIKVKQRIRYIKSFNSDSIVMAGNICTLAGAEYLAEAGADVIKVGIGNGSLCTTRLAAGCGLPQLTAIASVAGVKKKYPDVSVVADGGIKTPGDVVKALAAGADAVMIGNLLAGTKAAPGEVVTLGSFQKPSIYKHYRGSASMACKIQNGQDAKFIEGTTSLVPYRGKVESVLQPISDGLRSGMSYVGAKNLVELRNRAVFAEVTSHGYVEGTPHGVITVDY
jgi:IMP dehydrogenase